MKITRREFAASALSAAVLPSALAASAAEDGLRLRFLGTGAADWNGPDERGECRRLTSALLDGKILIDLTPGDLEMLPAGVRPDVIFYTHSHGDHYNPASALRLGIGKAYVHASWAEGARRDFADAAAQLKLDSPEVIGLKTGESATERGISLTICPAPLAPAYDGLEVVL